jgi:pyruvate kinase
MLSDETAMGAYPLEAVKILKKVIDRTEMSIYKRNVAE